jgi:hypothetical protein
MDRISRMTSSSDSKETYFITGLPDFVATLHNEERFGKERYIVEVTEFTTQAYEVFDSYDEAKKFLDEFLEKRIKTAEEHSDFEEPSYTVNIKDVGLSRDWEESLYPPLPPLPPLPQCCEDPILEFHKESGFPTEEPTFSDSEKLDKIISLLEEIKNKL